MSEMASTTPQTLTNNLYLEQQTSNHKHSTTNNESRTPTLQLLTNSSPENQSSPQHSTPKPKPQTPKPQTCRNIDMVVPQPPSSSRLRRRGYLEGWGGGCELVEGGEVCSMGICDAAFSCALSCFPALFCARELCDTYAAMGLEAGACGKAPTNMRWFG